ncbi:MAG: dUTP diphosphatase [Mycoplasmatota bacterium]
MEINIKKVKENATIPTRGSEYAAGYDLYACIEEDLVIQPHTSVMISTGISLEIPVNYAGLIYARSGLASKKDLAPANKVAVIDSDYRGEVFVVLHNHGTKEQTITVNERIAQFVFTPFLPVTFNEVDKLSETLRGEGGFGSTGRN